MVLVAAFALTTFVALPMPASAQSVDTIVRWNRILLDAIVVPGAVPPTVFNTRVMAMSSIAMFDAVNSFDGTYEAYGSFVRPAQGASRDAAASQAAHDILVALLPSLKETFDAALASSLQGISQDAARDGVAVGAAVAKATLELRADDGWSSPPLPFELPSLPGYWRPTPPANSNAAFTHYPYVRGFIVDNGRHFMIEGPPALTSARYAADFNEVKTIGEVNSTVRTAEQTQMARLWAGVNTTTVAQAVWNLVLADLAKQRGWNGVDTARGFALLNMVQHDALMTSFTGKFVYGLWRPITAIRMADQDGNAATDADPNWTSLIVTPPYPSAPGNMACIGGSQSRTMARLFGQDDVTFSVTWIQTGGAPSVTRTYGSFLQLANEEGNSRIWGGIHFRSETQSSLGQCPRIGDYAADNALRRR